MKFKVALRMSGHSAERIPPFYGYAWPDLDSMSVVFLPVPFNIVAAIARAFWLFLRHGWRSVPADARAAYAAGITDRVQEKVRRLSPSPEDIIVITFDKMPSEGALRAYNGVLGSFWPRREYPIIGLIGDQSLRTLTDRELNAAGLQRKRRSPIGMTGPIEATGATEKLTPPAG